VLEKLNRGGRRPSDDAAPSKLVPPDAASLTRAATSRADAPLEIGRAVLRPVVGGEHATEGVIIVRAF